jgi:NAD(P)-dependent dehydrogenase (short-subunit alcohol dehydrogenase family)
VNDPNGSNISIFPQDTINGLELYKHRQLRPLRKALASVFELHKMTLFEGKSEQEFYQQRLEERSLKRQKMAEKVTQKKYIADTQLRKQRVEKLQQLKLDSKNEEIERFQSLQAFMIPDGPADSNPSIETSLKMITNEKNDTDAILEDSQPIESTSKTLPNLRSCYVCKIRYRELHYFYDQLCPPCAELNFQKRHFSVPLTGRVAVVTGSRVKIGFQVCLKLLRAGCIVVATTRFPNSALVEYRKQPDFDSWKDNLQIYGLDLRDVIGLEAFTRYLKLHFSDRGIDILINNACQTVRRPAAYYTPIVQKEQDIWKKSDLIHKKMLCKCSEFENIRRSAYSDSQTDDHTMDKKISAITHENTAKDVSCNSTDMIHDVEENNTLASVSMISSSRNIVAPFEKTGITHATALSQMVILPDDVGLSESTLPPGLSDINGQQLDLRTTNSWLLKMEHVSTPEIMECMFINAIAPFVMNSRLQSLMTIIPQNQSNYPDRYIINVSAMEGKFYRYKMPNHPHTNMAKAALNMLTRTSSEDLVLNNRIYMNSVDTGWINDENPLEKASKIAKTNLFQTPIDEVDAAARILDPVFVGVDIDLNGKTDAKDYGKFFKDYRETEW